MQLQFQLKAEQQWCKCTVSLHVLNAIVGGFDTQQPFLQNHFLALGIQIVNERPGHSAGLKGPWFCEVVQGCLLLVTYIPI